MSPERFRLQAHLLRYDPPNEEPLLHPGCGRPRARVLDRSTQSGNREAGSGRPDAGPEADRWVAATLKKMTLDEKVGQLIVSSFRAEYLSTDSHEYEALVKAITDYKIGGFHVFGGTEPVPDVLLDAHYGTVTLGQPLAAASILNRLQAIAPYPLLVTADFETGAGFRLEGATGFPRNMAFGAAGDEKLAYEAGRITAVESRAIGVHVNFAPVVDVNNNPRNPVINTRSYGEDPELVGKLGASYIRGLQGAGMLATLKHFPGHGDTDVDSHLGLPIIKDPRESLEKTEFPPFKAGIAAGAGAIMTAHIEMPALDPTPATPTTLSAPIVTGVLRREMGFGGLVYTDSMGMAGVRRSTPPARPPFARSRRATISSSIRRTMQRRLRGSRRRCCRARFRPRSSTPRSSVCSARKRAPGSTGRAPSTSTRWQTLSAAARIRPSPTT